MLRAKTPTVISVVIKFNYQHSSISWTLIFSDTDSVISLSSEAESRSWLTDRGELIHFSSWLATFGGTTQSRYQSRFPRIEPTVKKHSALSEPHYRHAALSEMNETKQKRYNKFKLL